MFLPNLLDSSLIGLEHSQVDILISPLVFTYPWADAERHDDVIYTTGTPSMYFYIYVYYQRLSGMGNGELWDSLERSGGQYRRK